MYREAEPQRERHLTIELSDLAHLERIRPPMIIKEIEYKGVQNEKSKSKSTNAKPKKVHSKSNKAAVENIQKKL